MFRNADSETSRKLCLESIGYDFTSESIFWVNGTRGDERLGGLDENIVYLNSEGFRSPEFSKEKPNDTYRVFILGGSTSFGAGVLDDQTFPYYLQTMYDNANLNFNVEIINAGWPGYSSIKETGMIKYRLLGPW